ncbi:MAG: SGNH/GDSL hydrolase family protein [Saprospiraceae bacterium]|nr:SGNH/GDSL hydrolase family protein [Saprospiraceae bacterium]MDZ4706046.1 SGNH/GDSL hydrolase family protein [Saprospiraceae bacterium]
MNRTLIAARYALGVLLAIPLSPFLYFQGRRVKKTMPKLPGATGNEGAAGESERPLRLLVLGESTMAGVGVDTHENGFTGALARYLSERLTTGVSWKVFAESGHTAKTALERLVPLIQGAQADLVIVGLGANDAFTVNRPERWGRQVVALIAALREKLGGVPIVFLSVPPIREFPAFSRPLRFIVGNLAVLLSKELDRRVVNQPGVYHASKCLVLQEWFKIHGAHLKRSDFFSDGVHPSELTYRIWAETTGAFILEKNLI